MACFASSHGGRAVIREAFSGLHRIGGRHRIQRVGGAVADDSVDISKELKSDNLERDLTGTLHRRIRIVATKAPGRGRSSFEFVHDESRKVAGGMFASTENTVEIAFVETGAVAKLNIEDTCRGLAGGITREIVHGRGQEEWSIDVPGEFDDLSAGENGGESVNGTIKDHGHGMG